jgi:hypothetical protein
VLLKRSPIPGSPRRAQLAVDVIGEQDFELFTTQHFSYLLLLSGGCMTQLELQKPRQFRPATIQP